MPKFPKPFFRTARKAWFVQLAGKQINLGPDRDAAFRRYHELMGRPKAAPRPSPPMPSSACSTPSWTGARSTRPAAPTTGTATTSNRSPGRSRRA